MIEHYQDFAARLSQTLTEFDWSPVARLGLALQAAWREGRQVFIAGNGGSAGNAIHIANDLIYGAAAEDGVGLRVHALPANQSVVTCLANDCGYEDIFSRQLAVFGQPGDLLITLSGSGNSPNILNAIEAAHRQDMQTWAIVGYSGGKAKTLSQEYIHFAIDDMQIAENCQQVIGHMLMQWLAANGKGDPA